MHQERLKIIRVASNLRAGDHAQERDQIIGHCGRGRGRRGRLSRRHFILRKKGRRPRTAVILEHLEQLRPRQGRPVIRDRLRIDDPVDQVSRDLVAIVDHHFLEPDLSKLRQEGLQRRDGRLDGLLPVLLAEYALYICKDERCSPYLVSLSRPRNESMRTSIEAISVSAGAADAFVALGLKEVDLFKKGFGTAFILCAERAEWFELRDQRVGRSFGIVQVVLRVLSYTRCSRDLNRWR